MFYILLYNGPCFSETDQSIHSPKIAELSNG